MKIISVVKSVTESLSAKREVTTLGYCVTGQRRHSIEGRQLFFVTADHVGFLTNVYVCVRECVCCETLDRIVR